jgi:serine protease Do
MTRRFTCPHGPWTRPIAAAMLAVALLAPAHAFAPDAAMESAHPIEALLAKVIPTVVAIHTHRDISKSDDDSAKAAFAPKIQRAEGSGFIVSADGFIATNKHVVHGAYDVTVSLHDGRDLKAKIVWESTTVDVAFIKIEADRPLQAAILSRDPHVPLGRRVVAVGNPLGLGISASSGIVSAIDRNLRQSPYDSFIQTDAAINSGNSGGPLFDLDGNVVGMNSILWTVASGQGSQGLGFAIPAADISFLIEQLRGGGHIGCGTIGLQGQQLTPAMGEALGYPNPFGVIVAGMDAGSPAARAGLRLGDIVVNLDGKPLPDVTTLYRATCLALGHTTKIVVWRDGKTLTAEATPDLAPDGKLGADDDAARMAPRFANARDLGLKLEPVDAATRRTFKLPASAHGFVVAEVADTSEAENAGLVRGDVIVSLQMRPLSGTETFDQAFAEQGEHGHRHVILLVKATGGDRWITFPVRLTGAP